MPKYVIRMAGETAKPGWIANVNPFVVVCCTIQNPVTKRIRINKRQLVMMRRKPWPISRILLPSPAVCADLYRRTTDNNARIVKMSMIDIRKKNIVCFVKLWNGLQSRRKFDEMKDVLYREITSQFPDYSFSKFENYKHCERLEGTKLR